MVFYVSEYFVQTNNPFIGSLAAESGWPALIEWSAYNEDTFELEFYFDSYRQARRPDEVDEVWLYISKPGKEDILNLTFIMCNSYKKSYMVHFTCFFVCFLFSFIHCIPS